MAEQAGGRVSILYEDNHVLCALKPAGMLSQADDTGAPDMLSAVKEYLKQTYGKKGDAYLGLVHRLDRPVGGVMAFAKTSKAAGRLSEQFRERKIRKIYFAALNGMPDMRQGKLEHRIIKDRSVNLVRVENFVENASGCYPDKEYAGLEYRVEATVKDSEPGGAYLTLVSVDLLTGRPHQIRAQFAHIGCPVAGDRKYGLAGSGASGPALWAASLTFAHPVKQSPVTVSAPPPNMYPWNLFDYEIFNRNISG